VAVFEDDLEVARALVADLDTDDVERRVASAARAGRDGGARCIEPLARALADPEPRVRAAAAEALVLLAERAHEHGDPPVAALAAVVRRLRDAARDPDPSVRRAILEVLALSDAPAAAPEFLAALSDENPGVRIEAVRGLWRGAGPEAGLAVSRMLDDCDSLVRYYAVLAVDELDPPGAAEALVARLDDTRAEVAAEAAFCLAERGDRRGLEVLCRTLWHRDLGLEAARLLGDLGDERAMPALRRYLGRWLADPFTRLQAAASLGRLGDSSGEPVLLKALRSWRRPLRGFAIELLSQLRSARAYDRILAIASDRRDYHCSTAARALGRYGDARAADLLCELLAEHADPDVREDAARALGEIGGAKALSALARAEENDRDDAVREAAREARSGAR
jgi:HEAT repeat protein